jgi:hypothetical protein
MLSESSAPAGVTGALFPYLEELARKVPEFGTSVPD